MKVFKIHEGLWRWTASDPRFALSEAAGSEVGCIYYESLKPSPSAAVLIDPLVPPQGSSEAERFWRALDRDVARVGGPVAVILGTEHHARSAQRILDRYRPTSRASLYVRGAGAPLPSGVRTYTTDALGETESVYFLPEHRALYFADVLIGTGDGRASLTPRSWARPGEAAATANRDDLRTFLTRLAELPVEMLLFSHGEPVLERGAEALLEALSAPRWDRAFCPDMELAMSGAGGST